MDKVIVTALLTAASVIAAVMVVNVVMPALGKSGSSVMSSSSAAAEVIKTDIEIIAVATNAADTEIYVWIKNVGASRISAIDRSDVFLERVATSFTRQNYEDPGATDACANAPATSGNWWYCLEDNETLWKPNTTVKITLTVGALVPDNYTIQYITSNGVKAEKDFSV